jgi:hypothetical protein
LVTKGLARLVCHLTNIPKRADIAQQRFYEKIVKKVQSGLSFLDPTVMLAEKQRVLVFFASAFVVVEKLLVLL